MDIYDILAKAVQKGLNTMNSYDIVAKAVREFWQENDPQEVIAFFYQKYAHEESWEWHEELVLCFASNDYENMEFLNDFCEGQTCVKDLTIVPLSDVTEFYADKILNERIDRHE